MDKPGGLTYMCLVFYVTGIQILVLFLWKKFISFFYSFDYKTVYLDLLHELHWIFSGGHPVDVFENKKIWNSSTLLHVHLLMNDSIRPCFSA